MIYTRDHLNPYIETGIAEIGEYTYGHPIIRHWGEQTKLFIGKYCSIADGVQIFLGGNHRIDWVTTYPFSHLPGWSEAESIIGHPSSKGDVIIGNDVWIASDVKILSGITIGDGAVIGAGAIVTKSVEPYSIVAGNPAKLIKYRFKPEEIEKLLKIQWWNWQAEKVNSLIPWLLSDNLDAFFAKCESIT